MSTTIRPEITQKSPYWIDRHRYYELKHFCLQYPSWKKSLSELNGTLFDSLAANDKVCTNSLSDPTAKAAEKKIFYSDRLEMVEETAVEAAEDISEYILKGVTEELSYDILRVRFGIPCCKEKYYEIYRKFFFLLSEKRQ